MPPTENSGELQSCPNCAALLDTSDEEPLAQVHCPICGTALRVERTYNSFVLLELLGKGGMGGVYKARDTSLNRLVALKLLRKNLGEDNETAATLEHEARVTASINHAHVVKVYSSGSDHGQFYLAMELVDNGSLDDLIEAETKVSEEQVLAVGLQIARGLEAAQAVGLIHRDVKPGNILFADGQTAKIVDFGLAILAEKEAGERGEIWGTPYYVAPEKLAGGPEDFRSDIYSLGATLFHAVSGSPPYEVTTNSASALRKIKSEPVNVQTVAPGITKETAYVINRMIHADPDERYGSYRDLIDHLQYAHTNVVELAKGPIAPERRATFGGLALLRRIPGGLPVLLAAILILAAGIFFILNGRGKHSSPAVAATQVESAPLSPQTSATQTQIDDARRQMIEGHYDAAKTQLTALLEKTKGDQPTFNWVRMNRGLLYLLSRQTAEARETFKQIESTDLYSARAEDHKLATFFVEASKELGSANPIPASLAQKYRTNSFESFGLFLFALKDWELGDFADAGAFLKEFMASHLAPEFGWISDYKQLAGKFSDDYHTYASWLDELKAVSNLEQLKAAQVSLQGLENKLQLNGKLNEELKKEEGGLTTEVAKLAAANSAGSPADSASTSAPISPAQTPEATKKPADPVEIASWHTALQTYQSMVRAYRFPEALATVQRPQLTDNDLKTAQDQTIKKAQWLIAWKKKLLDDLNRTNYPGPVYNVAGIRFDAAITHATETQMFLRTPYGTVPLRWLDLTPKMLLAISYSFIKPGLPDSGDRAWLSAIFAWETAQVEAANTLAHQAAQAKPEYADQIAIFFTPAVAP